MPSPKVAIVVDWLTDVGGAERVIRSVHEAFPEAPIYTSQYNPKAINWFDDADVRAGWLQRLPLALRKFLPILRMVYFSNLKLTDYDVIISITGAEAKAVKTNNKQVHISYMHAPTQYYWGLYEQYVKDPGFGWLNPLVRIVLKLTVGILRKFDYNYAQRPDYVIANSTYIASDIKKYYDRDSDIIFPPVETGYFKLQKKKDDYFIITSRHVPWKKVDLAVEACLRTGEKLIVVGSGTETENLKSLAFTDTIYDTKAVRLKNTTRESMITFVDTISDTKKLAKLVAGAKGFIFPSLEPFGIAPVEALATGTPVLAYRAGGALDYIDTSKNGVFFDEQTVDAVVDAINEFNTKTFDAATVSKTADKFKTDSFKEQIRDFVYEKVAKKAQNS